MNVNIKDCEAELKQQFDAIDEICYFNQKKVLNGFIANRISVADFAGSTGYGYDDRGRDNLAKLYATVFGGESAIVSPLLTCGSHAISTVLYGLLRPLDTLLSISGPLYDTLQQTLKGSSGSLEDFGIKYQQIELDKNGALQQEEIYKAVKAIKPKVVFLQRSRGYSSRRPFSIEDMQPVFKKIKQICPDSFIVVDNCYGEFVQKQEPTEVGADVIVGSLIKNPGGGLAPTGGYIVGSSKAINLIATRFTNPSLLLEVGSYEGGYRNFYQGFFLAPHTVAQSVKGAYLVGKVMEKKGYTVIPASSEPAYDIIKSIVFNTDQQLIQFVQLVQKVSPIDSFVTPMPWDMPGYEDQVVMSAGTFVGGASIELSCDSPVRKPYIAYFQGGLTYEHVKILAEKLNELY